MTNRHIFILAVALILLPAATHGQNAAAQITTSEPESDGILVELALKQAQLRKAIADADRAELLARAPLAVPPLAGTLDSKGFGAAGLVRAFDLANALAAEVCADLPDGRLTLLYDPGAAQGVVAARTVANGIDLNGAQLARQIAQLQAIIDGLQPRQDTQATLAAPLLPVVVPATIKAVADLAGLVKTNVSVASLAYGDGTRALFATALAQACGPRIAGLGSGYFGELDLARHDRLMGSVRALAAQRGELAQRIAMVLQLAEGAKGDVKKALAGSASSAAALLKTVDAFIDSLRAGEASDKSPLFNAARYLGYADRTAGALVLDADLRLDGISIVKENWLTGQHLRVSGVALLWYRLHEADGTVLRARTLRRVARPAEVDLRGSDFVDVFR